MNRTDKMSQNECPQCMLAGFCHGADVSEEVSDSLRWRAIMIALIVPLILILTSLVVMLKIGASEGQAALTSISLPSVYYLSFFIYYKLQKRKTTCLRQ